MDFDLDTMYGPYSVKATSVIVPMAATTQLLEANPQRVCLIIGVSTTQNVQVSTRPGLLQTTGLSLGVNGVSFLEVRASEYGPLVGSAWFAAATAQSTVEILEVIRVYQPPEKPVSNVREMVSVVYTALQQGDSADGYAGPPVERPPAWLDFFGPGNQRLRGQLPGRGGPWWRDTNPQRDASAGPDEA